MRNCCDPDGVHARPGVFSSDRRDKPACVRLHHVASSRGNPSAYAYNRPSLHSDTPTYSAFTLMPLNNEPEARGPSILRVQRQF